MEQCGTILPEQAIRSLNKEILSSLSKDPAPDVERLRTLLRDVLRTTEEVRLDNTHRAAACDALCGLLRNGLSSPDIRLRDLCTDFEIWKRALNMFFNRNNDARPRPMKQVLETLIRLLQEMPAHNSNRGRKCLQYSIEKCVGHLLDEEGINYARPAMFFLDNLLRKNLLKAAELVDVTGGPVRKPEFPEDFDKAEVLVYTVLLWGRNPDLSPVCGRFLNSLCSQLAIDEKDSKEQIARDFRASWEMPIRQFLDQYPDLIGVLEQNVLPNLLRLDSEINARMIHDLPFAALLHEQTFSLSETDIRLCLLLLRINDELSFASFDDEFKGEMASFHPKECTPNLSVAERICVNMLRHGNPDIRLAAMAIIIAPRMAARPLNEGVLSHLQERIWDFSEDTDARIRNDYLSLLKRLFTKLEALANRLSKLGSATQIQGGRHVAKAWPTDEVPNLRDLLVANVHFIAACQRRILIELVPTASYQRHFLALRTLTYIRNLNIPGAVMQLLPELHADKWLIRSLLDLVMDPFEDIRSAAATLLLSFGPDHNLLEQGLANAEQLMRASGRADHADGYGRLFDVFERQKVLNAGTSGTMSNSISGSTALEGRSLPVVDLAALIADIDGLVEAAKLDLERAVADAPLHGRIIALKHLISSPASGILFSASDDTSQVQSIVNKEQLSTLMARLVHACEQIWQLVHPILCDDSPEGTNFLADEEDDAPDIGIKDTLSYAWRALKESSLLLTALLFAATKNSSIGPNELTAIGNILFIQLAELRHRGAFSAVARAYAAFCGYCAANASEHATELMAKMYEDTLACIQEKSTALTRRSAGLPALTVGLLCANPGGPLTPQAMADLQKIATQPIGPGVTSELPQVHALNCLKDIFTNTKLGPATETYLSDMFEIAVDCLDRDLWAIRNSGLMLLKALLLRLEEGRVNSNAVYQQSRRGHLSTTAYAKHPALGDMILGLLRKATVNDTSNGSPQQQERIIERTFPAIEIIERVGIPPNIEPEVKSLLLQHLYSPVWVMRNKAAACLAILLGPSEALSRLTDVTNSTSSNQLHGSLLLVRHILRCGRLQQSGHLGLIKALGRAWDVYVTENTSPHVLELYYENLISIMTLGTSEDRDAAVSALEESAQVYEQVRKSMEGVLPVHTQAGGSMKVIFTVRNPESSKRADLTNMSRATAFGHVVADPLYNLVDLLKYGDEQSPAAVLGMFGAFRALKLLPGDNGWLQMVIHAIENVSDYDAATLSVYIEYLSDAIRPWMTEKSAGMKLIMGDRCLQLCRRALEARSDTFATNALIRFWGSTAGLLADSTNDQAPSCYAQWHALLRSAMSDQMDVDLREAAVDSILAFLKVPKRALLGSLGLSKMVPILVVLYDGLVDDDEEIRLKASQAISRILYATKASLDTKTSPESTLAVDRGPKASCSPNEDPPRLTEWVDRGSSDFSPAAARQELVNLLKGSFSDSILLAREALSRIVGCELTQLNTKSFEMRLRFAEEKSTTLFDEEKQNLFADDFQEAQTWANIAKCLTTAPALAQQHILPWAEAGILALVDKLQQNTKAAGQGPLGVLSRPEIFLLVSRVLLAIDLCLHMANSVDGMTQATSNLRSEMVRLADVVGSGNRTLCHMSDELYKLMQAALRTS